MEIVEYNEHNNLIEFYFSRGLEFDDENKKYEQEPLFSYVVKDQGNLIGASTSYKKNEYYVIDYIAINSENIGKGIGSKLLKVTIEHIKNLGGKKIYIVAKEPGFFSKNGFMIIEKTEELNFSVCFKCPDYKVKCFPEIMLYEISM